MTNLPSHVLAFAANDNETVRLFESFKDYWNQYRSTGAKKYEFAEGLTLEQKGKLLNEAMLREIGKRANVDFTSAPISSFANHPIVCWAAGLLASMMIEAILPDTIIESTSAYSEVRQLALGETGVFDIESRDLFPVSKAGRPGGMRSAELHKGFEGQVTLNPEFRQITVGVNMFRVLTGLESLAKFTVKALRSIETEMSKDIYDVFAAAAAALTVNATTGLRVTGYTQKDLTQIAQRVSAFNGGAAPVVLGTKVALANILPDDANYRYDIESPYVTLGYVRTIAGITVMELPQVANWSNPFATYIADTNLFVVAPGVDKIVKVVLGGDMLSNVSNYWDHATLIQDATLIKGWKAGVVTSSVAGIITL